MSSTKKRKNASEAGAITANFDKDTVLRMVRALKTSNSQAAIGKQSSSSVISTHSLTGEAITAVEDLPAFDVMGRIEDLVVSVVMQIMNENSFEMATPNRSAGNQLYLENEDRIVLGSKVTRRQSLNVAHVRKNAITTRVMQLVHEVLATGIHITKRDLFCKFFLMIFVT